ncbi:hypothetical protein WJX72_006876 [[Myrmecia] bisecta]|uniref:Nuclear cap-binding protein subunit 2 n=1 Tax=[Myrmecia] bisecta TaxID=41462 RepID=A0AAW1PP05_9CHLO
MARLLKQLEPQLSQYRDRRFEGGQEAFEHCLRTSTTVYVGNLSFYTTEEQIYEVFQRAGDIQRIIMGLDKNQMTPCGFCFVSYYTREDTEDCVKYISGTTMDDRPIRVDFDWGFKDGRQYGRGKSGGQVRDEYRLDYDSGRGGYGKIFSKEMLERQAAMQAQMGQYADGMQDAADLDQPPAAKRARRDDRSNPRHRDRDSDEDD